MLHDWCIPKISSLEEGIAKEQSNKALSISISSLCRSMRLLASLQYTTVSPHCTSASLATVCVC